MDVSSPATLQLASATVHTTLKIFVNKPVARSYVVDQYFLAADGDTSINDVSMRDSLLRMASRNLTMLGVETTSTVSSTNITTSPCYFSVQLRIAKQALLVENDLQTQVREFVRQYVYLFVPLWFVVDLAVRWMLSNRIYSTRPRRNYQLR